MAILFNCYSGRLRTEDNTLKTEIVLTIEDHKNTLAEQSVVYDGHPIQPIPVIGDTIRLEVGDDTFSGRVMSRQFDYTEVHESLGEHALLVISVVAEEIP